MACLNFYTIRQWRFISDNSIRLLEKMSPADRKTFYFDVREINWIEYIRNYVAGTRKYILKDTTTSDEARVIIKRCDIIAQKPTSHCDNMRELDRFYFLFSRFYWLQKATHAIILLILVFVAFRLFSWIFGGALLAT